MGPHGAWHALVPLIKGKKKTEMRGQEDLP